MKNRMPDTNPPKTGPRRTKQRQRLPDISSRGALGLQTQDLSHDALANDMGQRGWNWEARYVAVWHRWLFWDGLRWAKDEKRTVMTRTRAYLRERALEVLAWAEEKAKGAPAAEVEKAREWAEREARKLGDKHTVAAVEAMAQSNPASQATPADFDADTLLLGTPGGTVNLRTGLLRPARPEDMVTRLTTVGPAEGEPTRWLAFLRDVTGGDEEFIAFLQRLAGYALTGETREHKLFFLYGPGRNGKSVFLNALQHLMGSYAKSAPATLLLNSHNDKHPTDLAGLQGARLVVGSELPRGSSWDEARIKDLTGGDVVSARFMGGNFFDYVPQFTLMIAGNTLPTFKGVDEALRRRMVVIPFARIVPAEEVDPLLPEALKQEAGQILAWAVAGAMEWQRRGLDVPSKILAASQDYLEGEDTLGQFLADETVREPGAFVCSSDLHKRSQGWWQRHGLTPWTVHTLVKELKARGIQYHRTSTGRGFTGLRLTEASPQ